MNRKNNKIVAFTSMKLKTASYLNFIDLESFKFDMTTEICLKFEGNFWKTDANSQPSRGEGWSSIAL